MSSSRTFRIADGHADSLMWNRDLTVRSDEGQVDFPRLQEAGACLQCFTIVSRGFPFVGGFPVFAMARGWPLAAVKGEWARTLWQIDRLQNFCERSPGLVRLADSRRRLDENLEQGVISAVLGVEGAHALEGNIDRVAELHQRGVRFMSLTHLANNELGGSSTPAMGNRGLTALGGQVLDAMARVGMAVDVAHASDRTLADIFDHPTARPLCSHTGVRGAGGSWRNLNDDVLRAIADKGGVVGIIYATVYLGGRALDDVVRHIEYALGVMGEDGVALGSDFDGMVPLPVGMRDVRDVPRIADALLAKGHPEARVEKIMGANWCRFFRETLGSSEPAQK